MSKITLETDFGPQIMASAQGYPEWYPPNTESGDLPRYCAEHDIELVLGCYFWDLNCTVPENIIDVNDPSFLYFLQPAIDSCIEAGCDYWVNVEGAMYWSQLRYHRDESPFNIPLYYDRIPHVESTTTFGEYETKFGPMIDYFSDETSPHFKGYQFEGLWDTGFDWLYERKASRHGIYYMWDENFGMAPTGTYPYYGSGSAVGPDFRLSRSAKVAGTIYWLYGNADYTTWALSSFEKLIALIEYEPEGYTKPPVGIQQTLGVPMAWTDCGYNSLRDVGDATDEYQRAAYYLNYLKARTGPLEDLNIWLSASLNMHQGSYYEDVGHWRDILDWYINLKLTEAGTVVELEDVTLPNCSVVE